MGQVGGRELGVKNCLTIYVSKQERTNRPIKLAIQNHSCQKVITFRLIKQNRVLLLRCSESGKCWF